MHVYNVFCFLSRFIEKKEKWEYQEKDKLKLQERYVKHSDLKIYFDTDSKNSTDVFSLPTHELVTDICLIQWKINTDIFKDTFMCCWDKVMSN